MASNSDLIVKDNILLTLTDLIKDKAVIKVEQVISPKRIIVSSGDKLTKQLSSLVPLVPVGIISYEELKTDSYTHSGKLSPIFKPLEEKIYAHIIEKVLKKGTKISIQLMPDSYYYQDQRERSRFIQTEGIPCIIYVGNVTYQNLLVKEGYAIYNNSEYFRLKEVFLEKGDIDREFVEELSDSEILAISEKKGFWSNDFSFTDTMANVKSKLGKKSTLNDIQIKEEVAKIQDATTKRNKLKPEDRLKIRLKKREEQKNSYNRKYSEGSFGEQLSVHAKKYFPSRTSSEIINGIVAGILPKSAIQIGALWCGIPTQEEEFNGVGASSHPVEIVEVKKDGDVRPVLGQGFLSMVMGDRPPLEGLTIILSVNSRGIENFIAPLITQFRMDPIVPIRNIHIARFVRPIFSNREIYSKVFGKLPANLAKLVNAEQQYGSDNEDEVRELSRAIELLYLTLPIYVAVKQVQVKNLEGNRDSFTVTINCGVADVTSNFGYFPEYFNTIDDAFSIHAKKVKAIDKINTQKAISHIAKQIGSSSILNQFTFRTEVTPDSSKGIIKDFIGDLKGSSKDIKYSSFVLREGKFVEIPKEVSYNEAQEQAVGSAKNDLILNDNNSKLVVSKILAYKPSLGTSSNYNLMKTLLKVRDMTIDGDTGEQDKQVLLRHFIGSDINHIPVPIGSSSKYRTGTVTKNDLIPVGGSKSTSFLNNVLNIEAKIVLDPKFLNVAAKKPISSLFAVSSSNSGYKVYSFNYTNWKDNALIGLGTKAILKPFNLCATRQIESGDNSLITNLDVDYACSIGLPVVKVENNSSLSKLILTPIGFSNVNLDEETKSNIKDLSFIPVSFYEGNIARVNKVMGFISITGDSKYKNALTDIVANQGLSPSFVPEVCATFAYRLAGVKITLVPRVSENPASKVASVLKQEVSKLSKVEPGEAGNSVEGTYGTFKFYNSIYKGLSVVSDGSKRNQIRIGDNPNNTTEYSRDIIRQDIQFWNNINTSHIIGGVQKNPLQFKVNASGKKVVNIGLTDVFESKNGVILFFFKEINPSKKSTEVMVLRSSKYEDEMLDLIRRYIEELKSQLASKAATKGNIQSAIQKEVITKFKNIVQSIVNKDTPNLLETENVPDALNNINQILAAAKGFRGTHFLDECEPYVFSLFYQLGIVKASKYAMSFRVRPDRVPYSPPTSIDENYTTMTMEIFRPEPPKEEDRLNAYTDALKSNEEFINRMDTQEGFNSFITQQASEYVTKLTGNTNANSIESDLRKTIYTIAALQTVLLRYFDYVFSAYVVIKAGGSIIGPNGKIQLTTIDKNSNSNNPSKKEVGLVSQEVKDAIDLIKKEVSISIDRIKNDLKGVSKASKDLPDSGKISINNSDLLKDGYTVEDLIHINLEALSKVVSTAEQRVYDSKTPNGDHFATYENIKRILSASGLDNFNGTGSIQQTTSQIINRILVVYKQTIEALKNKEQSKNIVFLNNGGIEPRGAIPGSIAGITESLQILVGVTQKIRLATGGSLDFMRRKKLILRKPVPSIGIIEEYGVSSPLRVPGKKKPSYQVIGGVSTQAYIQLNTGISDLYISEKSKIKNVIEDEEGMDAIYNIMREPSEIVTVYNMLRSGRAMVRDSSLFTKGSNSLYKVGTNNESLQQSFRLIKRASIESANIDAYGTLLGMTDPHIDIREPLFGALGLSKFVAKTTKISSGGDTTSWKLDVFLLPYEAGYSTNKNLKKINKITTNKHLGDAAAWLGAAYNPAIVPDVFQGESSRIIKTDVKDFGSLNLNVFESKAIMSRYAISSVFSNLVAMHAIAKAKRKIMNGIIDKNIWHPSYYPDLTNVLSSITTEGSSVDQATVASLSKNIAGKSEGLVTELSLSSSDFNTLSNYSELGQTADIPISTITGGGVGELLGGVFGGIAAEAGGKKLGTTGAAYARKTLGRYASKGVKVLGKALSFVGALIDVPIALWETRGANTKINVQNTGVIDAALKDNMSIHVLLSQNFAAYALDFLQEFFAYEANSPGSGSDFIKNTALEAKSVINNAGSIEGIQFFNNGDVTGEGKTQRVSTASGAIISTYPIDTIVQNGTQQSFFLTDDGNGGSRKIDKLSIVIINSAVNGDPSANPDGDLAGKSMVDDFYSQDSATAFFKSYYSQASEKRTEIDLCGEELLQLIVDGQVAMFKTDIYSIALNPRYVATDPGIYYSAVLGIMGRLKLNHFAQYLIGYVPAALHNDKVSKLLGSDSYINDFYSKYIAIDVNKKGMNFKRIKDSYSVVSESFNVMFNSNPSSSGRNGFEEYFSILTNTFPLSNGRLIASRALTAFSLYRQIRNLNISAIKEPLGSDSILTELDPFLTNLNLLCNQIKNQLPASKRPTEAIPRLFNVNAFFAFNSNVQLPQTEALDIVVPGNTTKDTQTQQIKKYDKYTYDSSYFIKQVKECLVEHLIWIFNAYGNLFVGLNREDLQKTDPSYGIRYAIADELALQVVKEKGVSYTDAAAEVRDISLTEVKNNIISSYSLQIQKACDNIALYSNGSRLGKKSLYSEYICFLETFKELFLQVSYTKNKDGIYVKGYANAADSGVGSLTGNQSTKVGSFSIRTRKENSLWNISDIDDIEGHLKVFTSARETGEKERTVVSNSLDSVRATSSGKTELSSFSFANLQTTDAQANATNASFELFIRSLAFASIRYGVERPEYIPSVLARWKVQEVTKPNKGVVTSIVIYKTAICNEFLATYSNNFTQSTADWIKSAGNYLLTGNSPPLSASAIFTSATVALSIALFAALIAGAVVAVIVGVVVFVVLLIIQAFLLFTPKQATIASFQSDFLNNLRRQIGQTTIATTPLFTGVRTLLEQVQGLNETDLALISILGTKAYKLAGTNQHPRSEIYVNPPDLEDLLEASEFILQDTLSYLTLPLITKRQVITVGDVLSPGGHVIPDIRQFNENNQALSNTLLIQEGFFKDNMEKLPEFLQAEKAKALVLQSDKFVANRLEPNDPGSVEFSYRSGAIRFINNMEGVFAGYVQGTATQGKSVVTTFAVSGSSSKQPHHILNVESQLKRIYSKIKPKIVKNDSPSAEELKNIIEIANTLFPVGNVSRKKEIDTVFSYETSPKDEADIIKNSAIDAMFYLIMDKTQSSNLAFSNAANVLNKKAFLSSIIGKRFDNAYGNISGKISTLGNNVYQAAFKANSNETEALKIVNGGKENIRVSFNLWLDSSSGSSERAKTYFTYSNKKVLEILGTERGKGVGFFSREADIAYIREASSTGKTLSRVQTSADENESILIPVKKNELFLDDGYTGAVIVKNNILQNGLIFNDRILYWFLSRISTAKVSAMSTDGLAYIKAASTFRINYSHLSAETYTSFNRKNPESSDWSFVEIYAAKIALDSSGTEDTLKITWGHIFQALEDIGCFYAYIGYTTQISLASNQPQESAFFINRTDKVQEAPNAGNITKFATSSTTPSNISNGAFAATTGLSTQYVLDKLEQYMDQESSTQWDAFAKAGREVKNILSASSKMYPVAKLYFIRKERGGFVLYDDIFSYADILSVKIFDSSKTPGTTIMIQLANTENKLDNIIAAKDNSRNPFEVRSRADDQLSGLLLKAGTRIMVYLGYGNILTEENKYLGEIASTSANPDGTITIEARGPGWILNNPINVGAGSVNVPGKTLTISGDEILSAALPANPTDPKDPGIATIDKFGKPANVIARNLLLYTMLSKTDISRYGRLGSIVSETVEYSAGLVPADISQAYTHLAQNGMQSTGFDIGNWLSSSVEKITLALTGPLYASASETNAKGSEVSTFKMNTFARNILLSESMPAVAGTMDSIRIWLTKPARLISNSTTPEWKINSETYWEFIKEVLLPIPNSKVFLRSYETDGSLVIGQADEYYSMYRSKTLASATADSLFREIAALKETRKVIPMLRRFSQTCLLPLTKNPNFATVEMMAEVLTATLMGLLLNDIDAGKIVDILNKTSLATIPLPIIGTSSTASTNELYALLKNKRVQSYILAQLVSAMIGSNFAQSKTPSDDKTRFVDWLVKNKTPVEAGFVFNNTYAPGSEEYIKLRKLYEASDSFLETIDVDSVGQTISIIEKYSFSHNIFERILTKLEKNSDEELNKFLQVGMQLGFDGSVSPETIKNISKNLSESNTDKDYGKRVLFTFTACIARAYNNKMHKLRNLSPDKRKIQDQHFIFGDRDIIHNDAMTMLGYNEGQFVFEEIRASTGEKLTNSINIPVVSGALTLGADVLNKIGGLLAPFSSKVAKFDFYLDRVSSENAVGTDYTAKRLMVNLNNPGYFSASMSITEDQAPLINVLSIMATQQMAEMVKDWYGGTIFTYGDLERKPIDVVFMQDPVRDMYGPFEIKEVVHSFDVDGFISSMSPSVYTRSEARNITDDAEGSIASLISNTILGALGATILWKSRSLGARLLGKIPGIGERLVKFRSSIMAAHMVGGEVGLTKLFKQGYKLGVRAVTALGYNIILNRVIKASSYAKELTQAAKQLSSKKISGQKQLIDSWLSVNGFKDVDDFVKQFPNLVSGAESQLKELRMLYPDFSDVKAKFLSDKTLKTVTSANGDVVTRDNFDILIDLENKLEKFIVKDPEGLLESIKTGKDISTKTRAITDLQLAYSKFSSAFLNGEDIISSYSVGRFRGYNSGADFLHFVHGKTYSPSVAEKLEPIVPSKSLKDMSQREYVEYLKSSGISPGDEAVYVVKVRKEDRIVGLNLKNAKDDFKKTPKYQELYLHQQQTIGLVADQMFEKKLVIPGVKSILDFGWGGFFINITEQLDQSKVISKVYGTIRKDEITNITKNDIEALLKELSSSGFKGDIKFAVRPEAKFFEYDNIVIHALDPQDALKAEQILKSNLGSKIESTVAAFDSPNGTPSQILAKELDAYFQNAQKISVSRSVDDLVIDPVNAKSVVKLISSAENVVPSAVSALAIESIRRLNDSGNILDIAVGRVKSSVPFSDTLDNLLTSGNLGPEEVKGLQKGLDARTTLVEKEKYIENFINKLETAITEGKKFVKDADGTVINLNQNFIEDYKVFKTIEKEAVDKIVKDVAEELTKVRQQIASGVPYKELPPFAKKVIDDAIAISTETLNIAKETAEKEIYRLEKQLKDLTAAEDTAKKAITQKITEQKIKSSKIQKEIELAKKQASGEKLREMAVGNLDEAIKNRSGAIEEATRIIGQKGVKKTIVDGFMSVTLSTPESGVVDPKNYKVMSKTFQESRKILYSPDPQANFKSMVKSAGKLFGLYQTYSTVSSVVGDSVTEYRLKLGAQKATDSLVTLFMIYKGEPYLSNLEGLTRYKSKAITSDTSYWEYLKSRFYNFSEIGEFVAGSFGTIVQSSLTQYTDILQNSQIDTGLYSSIPGDIKFGGTSELGAGSSISIGETEASNKLKEFNKNNPSGMILVRQKTIKSTVSITKVNSKGQKYEVGDNSQACVYVSTMLIVAHYLRALNNGKDRDGVSINNETEVRAWIDKVTPYAASKQYIKKDRTGFNFITHPAGRVALFTDPKIGGFSNIKEIVIKGSSKIQGNTIAEALEKGYPVCPWLGPLGADSNNDHAEVIDGVTGSPGSRVFSVKDCGGQGDTACDENDNLFFYHIEKGTKKPSTFHLDGKTRRRPIWLFSYIFTKF